MGDVIFDNYSSRRQTFIAPLTFPDVRQSKDVITRISYGCDIWELRVDLLSASPDHLLGETNLPPIKYVEEQLKTLQRLSDLPILFTIRTKSQGGKFPDDAADEALELMLLAVRYDIAYIDVEIEWPQKLLDEITEKKGKTKVVASYHDWTGEIRWSSRELQSRFNAANHFGDIIKLSILSASLEDCYELGLFVHDYNKKYTKPLLAVGMGAHGQLSRITSPISLVTHPLIPFPSAPGQLSLAQVHQAQHLMGLLPAKEFFVKGSVVDAKAAANALQQGFKVLGYPYVASVDEKGTNQSDAEVFEATDRAGTAEDALSELFAAWTGRRAPFSILRTAWREAAAIET